MIPFFMLLLIPIVLQHVKIRGFGYQRKNKAALFLFFALLTVLVMLRHSSIGNDTPQYIRHFRRFAEMDWAAMAKANLEPGFKIFNKAVSLISGEPQFFLAVAAIVIIGMIYPTYKRLCVDASLTIVLFCTMSTFVMLFSGIRQMLAVGIGFICYDFTREKKLIPFLITVAAAVLFHTSAFMLLFMYPLYHVRITKKWLYAVVPLLMIVFLFNRQIFAVLGALLERYTKYDSGITSTGAYTMLILFAAFAVFSFLIPDERRMDEEMIGLRNFLLFALVLQMFAPLHMLAMRMNYYYIVFIPLLLPKVISCTSQRWSQVAVLGRHVMVLFFLAYFFLNAYRGGNLNVFPYHFFWENV